MYVHLILPAVPANLECRVFRAGPASLRPASAADVPDGPAKKSDIQRVIEHVQKKDPYGIFKNPVTEEMVRP